MNYANYVIAGYVLTAGVVAGYWLWISARLRRARRIPTVEQVSPDE